MENNLTDNYINNLFEFNKKSLLSKYRYMHHFSYIRELMICNDKLERIEQSAFRYCNGFQNGSVKFNSGLKYIGHFAFGNTNLRNKQIPSGTQCESDAF